MSDALAKVFALQQYEINKKLQAQLQAEAREERERVALISSPVYQMICEFAELPVIAAAAAWGERPVFKHTIWDYDRFVAGKRNSVDLREGSNTSIHLSCREDRDSGVMKYIVRSNNLTYERTTPNTEFTELFITHAARVLIPTAVETAITQVTEETSTSTNGRRRLRAV